MEAIMARNTETESAATAATESAPAATAAASGARPRIEFNLDAEAVASLVASGAEGFSEGQRVSRQDYIRGRWQGGKDKTIRGAIAKELTRLEGKKVPYQIVFQATKEKPAPAAAEAPAASE